MTQQHPPIFRKKHDSRRWTADEDDLLIASYLHTGGFIEAVQLLPHRSRAAIFNRMSTIRKAEVARVEYIAQRQAPEPTPEETLAPSEFAYEPPKTPTLEPAPRIGANSFLPKLDLDRREHIRKRCIWTIHQLAQELALMPVHVARVVQDLAQTDFRGPLPLNVTHNDEILTTQEQSHVTRAFNAFKLSKNSFSTI